MRNILVIVNPVAGTSKKKDFNTLFNKLLPAQEYSVEIKKTSYSGHTKEIIKDGLLKGFDLFVAVGGDGTVHEVAQELIHSTSALAIIPCGSGNGLARHLKIPLNPEKAIAKIRDWKFTEIDTGVFNKKTFLVTAGVGLEADVSKRFKESKKRGYISYALLSLKAFYSSTTFKVSSFSKKLVNLTIANSNQWGNNSLIAPKASLKDGKLDICLIEPMSIFNALWSYLLMYNGEISRSNKYHHYQSDKFYEKLESELPMQVDGEFIGFYDEINAFIRPSSLKILV